MTKRLFILLLVFTLVFSFALTVFADAGGDKEATVDLEEDELYLPKPAKETPPDHTPPANNPIDVAGA